MENLTEQQKAYLVLAQTLDTCVKRGSLERAEVLNYNAALELLDPVFFPKEDEKNSEV